MIKHAVWPTSVPPVYTAHWSQEDWDLFSEGFKPEDYGGGRYDQNDWEEYVTRKTNELISRFLGKNK